MNRGWLQGGQWFDWLPPRTLNGYARVLPLFVPECATVSLTELTSAIASNVRLNVTSKGLVLVHRYPRLTHTDDQVFDIYSFGPNSSDLRSDPATDAGSLIWISAFPVLVFFYLDN